VWSGPQSPDVACGQGRNARTCGEHRGVTIAAMKKLLLLVVIAALATLATKKVRSA
jgi:hypothetical protein